MSDRKRPPSYSDSYYILNGDPLIPLNVSLTVESQVEPQAKEPLVQDITPKRKANYFTLVRFTLKGSLHLLFISSFESIFYFLYVSVSEDAGIFSTINAYYSPLLQSCSTWSNTSRIILKDILSLGVNQTTLDSEGAMAAQNRYIYNSGLRQTSLIYSLVFLAVSVCMVILIKVKRIPIHWQRLFSEHMSFVLLLGLYEYFFYRTIIYKYATISTAELNKYIIDGLYQCLT